MTTFNPDSLEDVEKKLREGGYGDYGGSDLPFICPTCEVPFTNHDFDPDELFADLQIIFQKAEVGA